MTRAHTRVLLRKWLPAGVFAELRARVRHGVLLDRCGPFRITSERVPKSGMLPAANDCAVNAKDARTATVNHFMADASVKNRPGGRLLLFGFSVVV